MGSAGSVLVFGRPIKTWSIGVLFAQAGRRVLLIHDDAVEMATAQRQWESWRIRSLDAHRLSGIQDEQLAELTHWQVCSAFTAPVEESSLVVAMVVDYSDGDDVMHLEHRLPADRVFAVASLVAPIGGLLDRADHPERVVGLHFMHPAHKMRAVELIVTAATEPAYEKEAMDLCRNELKLFVLSCEDQVGFVVNRIHLAYFAAALRVREEMGLDPDDVDQMLELSLGVPVGPFRLMGAIGYDNIRATLQIMEDAYGSTYRAEGLVAPWASASSASKLAALRGQEREEYRAQKI